MDSPHHTDSSSSSSSSSSSRDSHAPVLLAPSTPAHTPHTAAVSSAAPLAATHDSPRGVVFIIHCPQLPPSVAAAPPTASSASSASSSLSAHGFRLTVPLSRLADMTLADFKLYLSHEYTPLLPRPEHQRLIHAGREWARGSQPMRELLPLEALARDGAAPVQLHLVVPAQFRRSGDSASTAASSSARAAARQSPTPPSSVPHQSPAAAPPIPHTPQPLTPTPSPVGQFVVINGLPYLAVPESASPPPPPDLDALRHFITQGQLMQRRILNLQQGLLQLHQHHHHHHNNQFVHHQGAGQHLPAHGAALNQLNVDNENIPLQQQQQQPQPVPGLTARIWVINLRWLAPLMGALWTVAKVLAFVLLLMPGTSWWKMAAMCGVGLLLHLVELGYITVPSGDSLNALATRWRTQLTDNIAPQQAWSERLLHVPGVQATARLMVVFVASLLPGMTNLIMPDGAGEVPEAAPDNVNDAEGDEQPAAAQAPEDQPPDAVPAH